MRGADNVITSTHHFLSLKCYAFSGHLTVNFYLQKWPSRKLMVDTA